MDASEESDLMDRAREFAEQFEAIRTHVEVLEERLRKVEEETRRQRNSHYRQRQARSQLPKAGKAAYNNGVRKT